MGFLKVLFLILVLLFIFSCSQESINEENLEDSYKYRAVDISFYPEIRETDASYFDADGKKVELLHVLKERGINTIRIRLWVNPEKKHSGLEEVSKFAKEVKNKGLHVWLCVHYSDHWADPGKQKCPADWEGLSFSDLKVKFADYTAEILDKTQPDIFQIGNEINPGFIFPYGNRFEHPNQFLQLLDTASNIIRANMPSTKIMIHYAGIRGALDFYKNIENIDFDIAGISYYPYWHGKSLDSLESCLQSLRAQNSCDVLIAETAYPFTLKWADQTNNIIGLEEQIIPSIPASPQGQKDFIQSLVDMQKNLGEYAIGIAYWAPEWIAFQGEESSSGSPWENQALFDFDHRELPALSVLGQAN